MNDIAFQSSTSLSPEVLVSAGALMEAAWPGYQSLFDGEMAAFQAAPDVFQPHFTTAISGGRVAGFSVLLASMMSDSLNAISWVVVDEAFRGRKIGGHLVSACVAEAFRRRKNIVLTTTVPDFYIGQGFRIVETFKNNENYLMMRDLPS